MAEQLQDGQHVWLRSRVRDLYLRADEDGRRVLVDASRASRNAAWRVDVMVGEYTIVLLQGAAYGRYLAATEAPAPAGRRGFRVEQRDFNNQELMTIPWQSVMSGSGDDVMLLHATDGNRYLRANGRDLQWVTDVTVDEMSDDSDMMHWVVEPIPQRDTIPPLPCPSQPPGFITVMLTPNPEEDRWRQIRYVREGHDVQVHEALVTCGRVNENDWATFQFRGTSVVNLRRELAQLLSELAAVQFTMCVRAGQNARLTLLVVDLPLDGDPFDIVILLPGSPVIPLLGNPDVDAA